MICRPIFIQPVFIQQRESGAGLNAATPELAGGSS
jgi:hypothetical protein